MPAAAAGVPGCAAPCRGQCRREPGPPDERLQGLPSPRGPEHPRPGLAPFPPEVPVTQRQTSLAPPATSPAQPIASVRWDGGAPVIIDQRALPDALVKWRLATVDDVVAAIRGLAVRGAPAIGIAGAYGLVVGLDEA